MSRRSLALAAAAERALAGVPRSPCAPATVVVKGKDTTQRRRCEPRGLGTDETGCVSAMRREAIALETCLEDGRGHRTRVSESEARAAAPARRSRSAASRHLRKRIPGSSGAGRNL